MWSLQCEAVSGKMHRASIEYKVRISEKCRLTLVFSLIHGVELKMNGSTVNLTKRVENVQRGMSNTNVELKNEKISGKLRL